MPIDSHIYYNIKHTSDMKQICQRRYKKYRAVRFDKKRYILVNAKNIEQPYLNSHSFTQNKEGIFTFSLLLLPPYEIQSPLSLPNLKKKKINNNCSKLKLVHSYKK